MIGDIFANSGLEAVLATLPDLRLEYDPDFLIANGENAAQGRGIVPDQARRLFRAGIDVITLGNHAWHKSEIVGFLDREARILRPANFPDGTPGRGSGVFVAANGAQVCVGNVLGRALMDPADDPFRAGDAILAEGRAKGATVAVIDFHAETTSEKRAFAQYVDGRATLVAGTHTHVQTADEHILPKGTAFITDIGMSGPQNSVIGNDIDSVVARFVTRRPQRFEVATGPCQVNAIVVDVDRSSGKATRIQRIALRDIPVDED